MDGADNDDADDMPEVQETVSVIPGSTLLWRIDSRPPHSAAVRKDTVYAVAEQCLSQCKMYK